MDEGLNCDRDGAITRHYNAYHRVGIREIIEERMRAG